MRQTQLDAYSEINRNGLINKNQTKIYNYIVDHEPSTQREILQALDMETNQSGRFTEMEQMGIIDGPAKRKCTITGYPATLWISTGSLPNKPKLSNKKQAIIRLGHLKSNLFMDKKEKQEIDEIVKLLKS